MSETPRKKLGCLDFRQNTDQDATCQRNVNIIQESKSEIGENDLQKESTA